MYPGTKLPGATNMTIAEVANKATGAVGMYQNLPEYLNQRAKAVGLDPSKDKYTSRESNQNCRISNWKGSSKCYTTNA